jgi:hypothetical protein
MIVNDIRKLRLEQAAVEEARGESVADDISEYRAQRQRMMSDLQKERLNQAAQADGAEAYKSPAEQVRAALGESMAAMKATTSINGGPRRMTLTPNSPQVFALRHIVSVLLVRQFERAATSGASAEGERCALLKASLSGADGYSVVDGEVDGRADELRRQIAAEIETIFSPLAQNAAGIDALIEMARSGARVD